MAAYTSTRPSPPGAKPSVYPELAEGRPVTKRCSLSFSPLREVVHLLGKRTRATGGLILLDRQDNSGFAFNRPHGIRLRRPRWPFAHRGLARRLSRGCCSERVYSDLIGIAASFREANRFGLRRKLVCAAF